MTEISLQFTQSQRESFLASERNRIAQNAATTSGIDAASTNPWAEQVNNNVYSVDLETGKIPNQRRSGRCWLFANLNILRERVLGAMKSDEKGFELSQSYLFFYDKYEKANFFYENIIATAGLDLDSREVAHLLRTPQEDGGQWDMIVSIIQKYGVVPQSVMPDTFSATDSSALNTQLNKKLRQDAKVLREMVKAGASDDELNAKRGEFLEVIYRMLAISLGTPPTEFDFSYRDSDKEYHAHKGLTPKSFYDEFVGLDLTEYVPIINAPSENKPYNQAFSVDLLGNVVGGREIKYVNVPMNTLKEVTIKQLKAGESVWFGCDVGQSSTRKSGLMSLDAFDTEALFDLEWTMDKKDRLEYGESLLTHAMVLTGVDLDGDTPLKWKVQNSWGEDIGKKGYFVMTDDWMDEYTYQVVIHKDHLPQEILDIYESEATVLPAWDPMGSLAGMY